jgi:hypothetical protein
LTASLRKLFRATLRLFPTYFRNAYADEMEQIFLERIAPLPPLAACAAAFAEILDVALSAIRVRFARSVFLRPALIGVLGTVVLAAAVTVHTLDWSPAAAAFAPLDSIDFNAHDPAGEFTLTIRHGRPVAATIDHVPLPGNHLLHSGDSIRFLGPSGRVVLAVAYYRERARIEWQARPRACRGQPADCTPYQ